MKKCTKKSINVFLTTLILFGAFAIPSGAIFATGAADTSQDQQIAQIQDTIANTIISSVKSHSKTDLMTTLKNKISKSDKEMLGKKAKDTLKQMKQDEANGIADPRYVNPMTLEASKMLSYVKSQVETAKNKGEKLYTQFEILNLTPQEANLSANQLASIKSTITTNMSDSVVNEVALENSGVATQQDIQQFQQADSFAIPISMLTNQDPVVPKDGTTSYAGWPGCVDNNGYGPWSFIGSDCWVPTMYYVQYCVADLANKMSITSRYCVYNQRNCSWIIGHSRYGHSHSAWEMTWLT
jgi:hypothetical protein